MGKPTIAVDIDDVLAKGTESLRLEVNKRLGVNLLAEHYQVPGEYWGYYERVWEAHGIGGKISQADLSPQMQQDQSHIPVFEGARETLSALKGRYDFLIVTAREPSWKPATERWVEVQFPGIFSEIIFTGGKAGLKDKSKGRICKENGASWLIDDNVEHAKSAIAEGINVVLFGSYGWHQNVTDEIVNCRDWAVVLEYFDGQA